MKRNHLLFLSCAVLLVGCTPKLPQGGFTLDGTVDGLEGTPIYLSYGTVTDTTTIVGGKFHFEGVVAAPVVRAALRACDGSDYRNPLQTSVYLEPARITAEGLTGSTFEGAVFSGSATQTLAEEYSRLLRPLVEKSMTMQERLATADSATRASIMAEYEAFTKDYTKVEGDFMDSHPDSYLALENKAFSLGHQTFEQVKNMYDSIPQQWAGTDAAREIEDEYNALKAIQPGAQAPEIDTQDLDGNPVKLSDFRGSYVILDFWASWCQPCRASNPHLLALYDKYKEKGLVVFCVADDDSDPSRARVAIEQDGTQSFIHTLRGLKRVNGAYDTSSDKSHAYAVHFLPTKFLIDPEGKIVFRVDDDEQIDAKLQEAYGF